MTSSGAEATARQRIVSRHAYLSGETNGWVAFVGSLLIVVATLALSIVVWSGMPAWLARGGAEVPSRRAPPRPPAATPEPSNESTAKLEVPLPSPAPSPGASQVQNADRAGASLAPPVPPPAPALVKPAASAASAAEPPSGISEALDAYRRAFNTLDAASVREIWPGADVATLASTFAERRYQHLSFDRCQTRVTAADHALVSCEGWISDVLNSGDPTMRRRRASWTIALQSVTGYWTIENISTN